MARRILKAAAPKAHMLADIILDRNAPNAVFFSQSAVETFLPGATDEARALSDFEADGCEAALWDSLLGLGWTYADIAAIVANPALRPQCGYGLPANCR